MKTIAKAFILLILIGFTSCKVAKEARTNGETFVSKLTSNKESIEKYVVQVRNDKDIKDSDKKALQDEYANLSTEFNGIYDNIVKELNDNFIKRGKCATVGYGAVVKEQEEKLKEATTKGELFQAHSNKALSGEEGSAGLDSIIKILTTLFTTLDKVNLKMCTDKIEALKFQSWEKVPVKNQ